MAGTRVAVSWPAVSGAVAVLTAEMTDCGVPVADLLDGHDQADVAEVLALITAAVLKACWPADRGAGLVQALGLLALERDAAQTGSRQ
jgi:hypothetical protein